VLNTAERDGSAHVKHAMPIEESPHPGHSCQRLPLRIEIGMTFNAVSKGASAAVTSGMTPIYPLKTFAKTWRRFSWDTCSVAKTPPA
jgi:hypothetical protein